MKKQILEFLLVIFIGGIAGGIIGSKINERANYREFEFRGGYSYCGGGYERSLSHVLVNEKNYDVEEMFEKVYEQYILMNGEPDELTIRLYNSKKEMDENIVAATKFYEKVSEKESSD